MPVPTAVAASEYIGPWGRLRSVLAVEELGGMLPLHEAIPAAASQLSSRDFQRWKCTLIGELARLTHSLHQRRCFHKDLYLCHFYVPQEDTQRLPDWPGRVFLIDLHRLARHEWLWWIWQVKDLAQLLYSSEIVGVGPRDRLRFWRLYLGTARHRFAAACLRRAVLFKWRRYRTHNDKESPS
jgi:heptose I phosphotransferase